jgi:hypothetical protein
VKSKIASLLIFIGIAIRLYSQADVTVFSGNTRSGCYGGNPVTSAPQQKWEFEMPAANCSDPIIVGDKILVNAYDKENSKGYQFALDKNTGKQIWSNNIPEQLSTPAVAGDKVLYGSKSKLTMALDLNSRNKIWRYTDGKKIHTVNFVADAVEKKIHAMNFVADAVGKKIHTVNFVADAVEKKIHTVNFVANAVEKKIHTVNFVADAVGKKIHTVNFVADAVGKKIHTVEAFFYG